MLGIDGHRIPCCRRASKASKRARHVRQCSRASLSFCAQTIVHAVVMTRVVLAILMSLWIPGVSADSFEFAGLKR